MININSLKLLYALAAGLITIVLMLFMTSALKYGNHQHGGTYFTIGIIMFSLVGLTTWYILSN